MRRAVLSFVLLATSGPAAAATRGPVQAIPCSTSIVFGTADWRAGVMTFRATVDVACSLGVAFTAALRSPSGCRLRSDSGGELRYELFSDAAMRSPIVSCERETTSLTGTGRGTFVLYGRVQGPVPAIGKFRDALTASISP